MAIDPRLYQKYSGRSGDPYKRLGEALAAGSRQKSATQAAKDRSFSQRYTIGTIKWRLWASAIGAIGFLLVLIFSKIWR